MDKTIDGVSLNYEYPEPLIIADQDIQTLNCREATNKLVLFYRQKIVIWYHIMNNTEADIIHKLKKGDEEAYTELFKNYYVPLCAYARRYVGRKDLAEEIVSETIFNIWVKRNNLDIKVSLKAYLFHAVCKNSLYYLRKLKKEEKLEDFLAKQNSDFSGITISPDELPSDSLILKDMGITISRVVDILPPQQQTAFRLKRYEGRKNKEIAEIMGISVKTVEMHLAKAMITLRSQLKHYLPFSLFTILLNEVFK